MDLDRGEAEAVVLAKELGADYLLVFRLKDNGEYDMPEIYMGSGTAGVGIFGRIGD